MKTKCAFALTIGLALITKAHAEIDVTQPWIQPSDGKNASLYMTIINKADTPDKLVKVETNVTADNEFHNSVVENGRVTDEKLSYIGVPKKGRNDLKPGRAHVTLQNVNNPLKPGQIVNVKLHFQSGNVVPLKVPVENK